LKVALETTIDVGVEVPALPNYYKKLVSLVNNLDTLGVKFLNLNELEYSDTNYRKLLREGYRIKSDTSNAIHGSESVASKVIRYCYNQKLSLSVHYCSSRFKDAVQLRRRLANRAKNVAKDYDIITIDGTLLKGVIEPEKKDYGSLSAVRRQLIEDFDVPEDLIVIDREKKRIETAPWLLDGIAYRVPYDCFLTEEYPTVDRLEVERTPVRTGRRF
jgi:hypothetical protein